MKKVLGRLLALSIASIGLVSITSCDNTAKNKDNDNIEQNDYSDDYRYTIYQSALESGYTGTYEEWLNSIKGAYILLQISGRYSILARTFVEL